MVYRAADGKVDALDYREKHPPLLSEDTCISIKWNTDKAKYRRTIGFRCTGHHRWFDYGQSKYGKLPFSALIEPAIEYATGYKITKDEATRFNGNKAVFSKYNEKSCFYKSDEWKTGDVLVNLSSLKPWV